MLCPGTRNFVRVERSRHIFAILRNDYNIRVQQAAGIGWIEGSLFRKTGDQDPGHRDQRFRHPFRHPVLPSRPPFSLCRTSERASQAQDRVKPFGLEREGAGAN